MSILERELQVQARRPFTVGLRVGVGLVASLTGLAGLRWAESGVLGNRGGQQLLQSLGWSALVFGLVEGVRQTADSVSREKREGTLGLLFLTDLRGWDVVLGKLAAHGLSLFYALMAAFPILGLALGAGGVTVGEFWRLPLVLLDTLFLAAASGLWSSARSYGDHEALLRALALMVGLTLLPAVACSVPPVQWMPSPSPAMLMVFSGDVPYRASPSRFWLSLLGVQAIAWGLLVWAGSTVQRRWREVPEPSQPARARIPDEAVWPYRIPSSLHSRRRVRGKAPALADNPAGWLAERRAPSCWLLWVALLLPPLGGIGTSLIWRMLGPSAAGGAMGVGMGMRVLTALLPVVLLGLAASRRMTDLRQSGALELLLCTPLSGVRLPLAEWNVLWCAMRWPLAVQGLLGLLLLFLYVQGARPAGGVVLDAATQLAGIAKTMLSAVATVWLGLWFGLRTRTPALAVGRIVFWVVLVPWLSMSALGLLSAWTSPAAWRSVAAVWMYALHASVYGLGTVYAVALILWARRRVVTRFREVATEQ